MRASNSKLKSFIKTKKINVFLLFLFLSFLILLLSKLSRSYTNTMAFNIKKVNVPEAHIVLNDSNNKLDITFKTYGFKWLRYYLQKPSISIDFEKDVIKNDSNYIWTRKRGFPNINAQFDKNVDLINVSPDTILFKYGAHAIKMIPVRVLTDIKYSPGYDLLGKLSAEPDSVRLIGPSILLEQIESINTDTLKLVDVRANIDLKLNLKTPENTDIKVSTHVIQLKGNVEKFTEGVLKIPLDVKNIPGDIRIKYFPKVVNISYYTSLVYFDSIRAQDFKVECDFSKITSDVSFLIPEITKSSEHVKNVKIDQNRIEFIITE